MGELDEVLARVWEASGKQEVEPGHGLRILFSRLGAKYGTAPEEPALGSREAEPTHEAEFEAAEDEESPEEVVAYWGDWVNRLPVLSHEEHVALAFDIEAGVYAQAVLEGLFVYREAVAEDDLLRLVHIGRQAFELMLTGNLKLVRRWTSIYAHGDLNIVEDMFQDAFFGLYRAVEGWDAERGYRFSTYASWQIRQSLQRSKHGGSAQKTPVHIPTHVYEDITQREKSDEEVSALGRIALDWMRAISWELLAEEIPEFHSELDEDFTDEVLSTLNVYHSVKQCLNLLSEDDAALIESRYGLFGEPKTLDAIGESRGITRERVRQIEKNIFERIVIHVATQVDELRPRLLNLLEPNDELPAKWARSAVELRLGTRGEMQKVLRIKKKEAMEAVGLMREGLKALELDPHDLPRIWLG